MAAPAVRPDAYSERRRPRLPMLFIGAGVVAVRGAAPVIRLATGTPPTRLRRAL